ncbi:ubiquitin-conjugating enzyme [Trifolium repens]|nr:ubiquitin-conjugating enzyme [Trifolium repens]
MSLYSGHVFPPIRLLNKRKRDASRVVIDISDDDDDDSDDLVIIGEKASQFIKGKTVEAVDQAILHDNDVVIIAEKVNKSSNFKDEILKKFGSFKQFDIASDTSDHIFVGRKYLSKELCPKQHQNNWAKRIQKEWKILENNLPDSIFVRVYESRMDLMRAGIIGAEGTPYHDGLFFFDLYLPDDFPNVPPKVWFHNPCSSYKLNPNFGRGGSLCLSLLNTWSGKKNERWRPRVSTILQVLVSIQGLVLTAEPFFNLLSGYVKGNEAGKIMSRFYNEDAFIDSLWTMIHVIRRPLKNFEDFVVGHFLIRADDILRACKAYRKGAQVCSLVKNEVHNVDHQVNESWPEDFTNSLRCPMKKLADEFARIGAMD